MKYFKKLLGDRIYLSPINSEDVEIFTKWLNDFSVTDYIGRSAYITTLSGEKKYLDEIDSKDVKFSIVTIKDDKMIGTISLDKKENVNQEAILGIFIGDKEYRSKRYGTESINLILDYGFNYLNLHSIRLDLMSFNERAMKCYKKCGFKECGRVRENRYINGKYYDTIIMDILKSEFQISNIQNKEQK